MKQGGYEITAAALVLISATIHLHVSLALAFIALIALGIYRSRTVEERNDRAMLRAINDRRSAHKRHLKAVLIEELQRRGEITNNEVERLLGVSDATAERYLQQLEEEGIVVQKGAVGAGVSYQLQKKRAEA